MDTSKEYIEGFLKKFDFVQWDRFTQDPYQDRATRRRYVLFNFYGWIDREDQYKDFVAISVRWPDKSVQYLITSSKKYSPILTEMCGFKGHIDCQRVEDRFEIPNSIKLAREPSQPSSP